MSLGRIDHMRGRLIAGRSRRGARSGAAKVSAGRAHGAGCAIAIICVVLHSSGAHAGATFMETLLGRPVIPQPKAPFVTIFFHAGGDETPYGLVVDGKMHVRDWRRVISHVGYLSPYSVFKPKNPAGWRNHGYDVAVRAAQAMGRPTGGSIMGIPSDSRERANVMDAYNSPMGLRMTHFFHDYERNLGIPGGEGKHRLEIEPNRRGAHLMTRLAPLSTGDAAGASNNWQLSFGANFGDYMFGGQTTIMGNDIGDDTPDGHIGWRVLFINKGGYTGHSNIVFATRAGEYVESSPLTAVQAMGWVKVRIAVVRAQDPRYNNVEVTVDGVGSTTGRIRRGSYYGGRFYLGDPNGMNKAVRYDDISISSGRLGGRKVLARYTFEHAHGRDGGALTVVKDVSGHGLDLSAVSNRENALQLQGTGGVDPNLFRRVRRILVGALLESRNRHGRPPPVLITNWALDNLPGRFGRWKAAGFTNGSTDYYLSGKLLPGQSPVEHILRDRTARTQWAWHEGSHWTHAWLGQTTVREKTLSPREYGALVTLGVLDGNRWFSVFTAMSRGRLGRRGLSKAQQAVINADALYDMAAAASRFQSTSTGLRDSVYLGQRPLLTPLPREAVFRARENMGTGEMWLAGYRPEGASQDAGCCVTVRLSTKRGTIVNLASGHRQVVTHGIFMLPLDSAAAPFYFSPALNG